MKRYGEYGHGDGKEDHRVVLDKNLLPTIEKDGNIRVFKPADLLQDFLRTFQDECKIADQLQQPVVLMVFGHGDQNTYGIAIGGRGDPANAPRLQIHHIVASLRGLNVSFTMLLTSCYSGGWLLQPNLNVSGLTAAGPRSPSLSWPATLGGRSHGSIYSTAVREALTKMESENATQIHPHSSGEILDEEKQSSTYAELCNVIHSTLLHDVDRFGHFHDNRFSAQNDMWELEWRRRSGLPLAAFEAQWEKLPRMIPQPGTSLRVSKKGGLSLGSSSTAEVAANGPYGLHPELNKSQAHRIIKDMAYGYLCSHPPIDNGAPDRLCNTTARALMRGDPVPSWKMRTLKDALTYRIGMTKFATEYKNVMGLDFMDCDKFDFELWLKNIHYGATKSKEKWTTYMKSLTMIDDARVFDQPLAGDGWAYTKPASYLAVAAVECGLSTEALAEAVAKVLTCKYLL